MPLGDIFLQLTTSHDKFASRTALTGGLQLPGRETCYRLRQAGQGMAQREFDDMESRELMSFERTPGNPLILIGQLAQRFCFALTTYRRLPARTTHWERVLSHS